MATDMARQSDAAMPPTFPIGPRKLAILVFMASESIIFLSLIVMYVEGQAHVSVPMAADNLSAARMIPFSVALWASSGAIALAHRPIERGNQRGMRAWLLATVILGAIFLAGEAAEWSELFTHQITVANNIWSTTFFTLTGVHGLHVIGGLIAIIALTVSSFRYPVGRGNDSAFEVVSVYWHFVDGMWVLIYSVIYIWSAFLKG